MNNRLLVLLLFQSLKWEFLWKADHGFQYFPRTLGRDAWDMQQFWVIQRFGVICVSCQLSENIFFHLGDTLTLHINIVQVTDKPFSAKIAWNNPQTVSSTAFRLSNAISAAMTSCDDDAGTIQLKQHSKRCTPLSDLIFFPGLFVNSSIVEIHVARRVPAWI